ncbi:hypothetical protein BPJM79_70139 [Bacillus pumilus]
MKKLFRLMTIDFGSQLQQMVQADQGDGRLNGLMLKTWRTTKLFTEEVI